MLLKVCILLLIFFLVYNYFYRGRDSKNLNHTDSEADSRFDISRVEEAQYRDIKTTHKESDRRE